MERRRCSKQRSCDPKLVWKLVSRRTTGSSGWDRAERSSESRNFTAHLSSKLRNSSAHPLFTTPGTGRKENLWREASTHEVEEPDAEFEDNYDWGLHRPRLTYWWGALGQRRYRRFQFLQMVAAYLLVPSTILSGVALHRNYEQSVEDELVRLFRALPETTSGSKLN